MKWMIWDKGQFPLGGSLTEKVIHDSTVVKARLVARGFEETTTNIRTDMHRRQM